MKVFLLLTLAVYAAAHCAIWHPSTFDDNRGNGNSDRNSQPLADMTFKQWWWRGYLDNPDAYPANGTVFNLPANGKAVIEISSNKAFTSMGSQGMIQPNTPDPWTGNKWSNIHAVNREDVAGCAFAIAYKSDPKQVKPEDFVIFSVVRDCIARQNQTFDVPNLPFCPNGKCMCSWFWIHKSAGGTDQMYMVPFVCKVTGASSKASPIDVARAQPPRKCRYPMNCFQGPRNPMYWKNLERNNMPEQGHYAPTYSTLYGFTDGAQNDIFKATNRVNQKVVPFPAEKPCMDAKWNPNKMSHRLSSNNNLFITSGGAGLVSPNCKWTSFVEGGSGALFVRNQQDGYVAVWIDPAKRDNGPYTVKVNADGTVTNSNAAGVQWTSPMTMNVGKPPYRLEITDEGQLILFDGLGLNRWESNNFDNTENNFLSTTPDPAEFAKGFKLPSANQQ